MEHLGTPFAYSAKLAECGSKHLALYLAIREAITEGKLAPGERLPSTRKLAELYELSRGSVSLAYEMLTAESFVQAGVGQGTFVSGWLQDDLGNAADKASKSSVEPDLTQWGRRLMDKQLPLAVSNEEAEPNGQTSPPARSRPSEVARPSSLSFVPEGVGAGWFPWMEWKAEVALQWKKFGTSWRNSGYTTEGSLELRQAIAGRLRRERGIACDPDDVIITAGSMQAIALLTQLLLEEGKTAVLENPSYTGILNAVEATGANVIAEQVDGNGIVPQDWAAQLLFVTPTRQFPTGAVLSYERRRALLAWASRRNAWIVEDDYDSDFRWGGRPIEPLKSLDREGRVIYVGTFSRSMSVGVRIGYAVVPKELVQPFIAAKKLYDPYPTGIAEQLALAKWMTEGGYDRHLRRMRRIYGKLENQLRVGLESHLEGLFEVIPSDAGLHVYARWKRSAEGYERLVRECAGRGLTWREGSLYDMPNRDSSQQPNPSALFGFAHMDEEQIEQGIKLIRRIAQTLGLIDSNRGQGGTVHA
ncbi:MocR-like pyridoxine biosynthesis transcription factor PdxR [Cohnella herbarum]|uniref:PLP-dependent aminotransferase family protein n=1 Tax=Cohnella herbarum TaxID=2728023 RepID=A0A7Z2VJ05_9BACL|nr:PLP-dependent aminotransferase family protein [Cohnella herbarum]QJD84088.1 PLP-dependent aminotransferase family protein [Cohnella herbarum]